MKKERSDLMYVASFCLLAAACGASFVIVSRRTYDISITINEDHFGVRDGEEPRIDYLIENHGSDSITLEGLDIDFRCALPSRLAPLPVTIPAGGSALISQVAAIEPKWLCPATSSEQTQQFPLIPMIRKNGRLLTSGGFNVPARFRRGLVSSVGDLVFTSDPDHSTARMIWVDRDKRLGRPTASLLFESGSTKAVDVQDAGLRSYIHVLRSDIAESGASRATLCVTAEVPSAERHSERLDIPIFAPPPAETRVMPACLVFAGNTEERHRIDVALSATEIVSITLKEGESDATSFAAELLEARDGISSVELNLSHYPDEWQNGAPLTLRYSARDGHRGLIEVPVYILGDDS